MPLPFFKRPTKSAINEFQHNECSSAYLKAPAQNASLEAKLFESVLQQSTHKFSTALDAVASSAQVFTHVPAAVCVEDAPRPTQSEVSSRRSEEDEAKGMTFVWVNITPDKLGLMSDIDIMRALQARNKGETDKVPAWMLEGLASVVGPVEWLMKVDVPANVKKGKKIKFSCSNVVVETTYEGCGKSTGRGEVFALQAKDNMMDNREVVWVNVAASDIAPHSQFQIVRALERRNHGVKDDVPAWLLQGLAHLGNVDFLLSVPVPPGAKRGQKVALSLNGQTLKAVYNGDASQAATHNVFAILGRAKTRASSTH